MWWIGLVVFGAVVLIVVIVAVLSLNKGDHHDYQDHQDFKSGGGIQVGGSEKVPFFAPANDKAGMLGEDAVFRHLRPMLQNDEYIMANLLLPLGNGYKTEIDCVIISRKGIFCIEIKNWVGHINGSDDDEYWIQQYDDSYMADREHENPVKQNEKHCKALTRILRYNYRINNAVIFARLEDNYDIDSDYVFTIREFKDYFLDLIDDELTETQVKSVYEMLHPYVATQEQLKKHKESIKNMYH